MKRTTRFDTLGIFQAVKFGRSPLRVVLLRTFFPENDPYEANHNPYVDTRPYYGGKVRYSAVLFVGSDLRMQIEVGPRS